MQAPDSSGNGHPSLAPYEPYPAADGQVIVAAANPRLWSRFCAAIGARSLEHHPLFADNSERVKNRAALKARISELFADKTVDWLIERLSAAGVPCGRVRALEEVLEDPQLAARDMLVGFAAGGRTVKVPGNPIKLSNVGPLPSTMPPALGEHTDAVRAAVDRVTRREA